MAAGPELTAAEIDAVLERFDQTDPALQRQIVARFVHDRAVLAAALECAVGHINRLVGDDVRFRDAQQYLEMLVAKGHVPIGTRV